MLPKSTVGYLKNGAVKSHILTESPRECKNAHAIPLTQARVVLCNLRQVT